eukprot:scaffold115871_cov70-Phaeocystis_antarctica.AAC.3
MHTSRRSRYPSLRLQQAGGASVGKKKGGDTTRQRGLKLRLRDPGKIWVLALAPERSRPLQAAPYAISRPHPSPAQPLQKPRAAITQRPAGLTAATRYDTRST